VFRRAVLSLLLPVLSASPALAQAPGPVSVVYRDGSALTVTGWSFTYLYGASDQPFTGGPYLQLRKRTTDLLLTVGTPADAGGPATEERRLAASELAGIRYHWTRADGRDTVATIVVTLADGDSLRLAPPLRLAATQLTKQPFVFATSIWLHGTMTAEGRESGFDLRIDAPEAEGPASQQLSELRFGRAAGE
jgi:hypothetical protein